MICEVILLKKSVILLLISIFFLQYGFAKSAEFSQLEILDEGVKTTSKQSLQKEVIQDKEGKRMKIQVQSGDLVIVYALNDSQAAKDLYSQLPLSLEVKDFSTNEKTFYPPKALDVSDAPIVNADKGSLCYYAPWEDVVMFYDYLGKGTNLYTLGEVISGKDNIEKLTGMITVTAYDENEERDLVRVTVNGKVLKVKLYDNSSAEAVKEMLKTRPVTIDMRDYGRMEKVGSLGIQLPRNDEHITTAAGDVILYEGEYLVIYYAPNTWKFTRLGKVQDVTAEELKAILGEGNVTVTLTLD